MITSPQLMMLSTGLGFMQSYNQAKMAKLEGKQSQFFGNLEADRLLQSATARMNQGGREAQMEQYKGRVMESDAIAAMAASGGGIDPVLLAKIKQRADSNAMAAIYEAGTESSDLKYEAAMARIGGDAARTRGRAESSDIMFGAYSTALSKWPRGAAQKTGNARPAGYNWRSVANQGQRQGRGGY